MTRIESVHAREVFDSRGKPTVEVEIVCAGSRLPGRAIVPSGASTGKLEARELRDGDPQRLAGQGVLRAVANVNGPIADALRGWKPTTSNRSTRSCVSSTARPDKSRLGANALLGASLAAAYASAQTQGVLLVEHLHALWRRVPATSQRREAGRAPYRIGRWAHPAAADGEHDLAAACTPAAISTFRIF